MTWIYGINSDMGYNNELITFWNNSNTMTTTKKCSSCIIS